VTRERLHRKARFGLDIPHNQNDPLRKFNVRLSAHGVNSSSFLIDQSDVNPSLAAPHLIGVVKI
jgi:hypothetical protein